MPTIATTYGTLAGRIYGGPTLDGSTCYSNDGKYPTAAHIFGRNPEPDYIGATVQTPDQSTLTINGVAYAVMARFTFDGSTWTEDRSGYGYHLKRAGGYFSDGITDAARRVWYDRIVPAIVAALTAATAETDAARIEARATLADNLAARVVQLRAEAARIDAIAARL